MTDQDAPTNDQNASANPLRRPALPPVDPQYADVPLPDSWSTVIDKASDWPYVDPDEAMETISEKIKSELLEYKDFSVREIDPTEEPEFTEVTPWGKMQGETDREYELFCYYRALGMGRKKSDVARHFDVSTAYVAKVVGKNNWDDRILAWDRHIEAEYTKEVLLRVRGMAGEHAQIARLGVQALSTAFFALIDRMDHDPDGFQAEIEALPLKQLYAIVHRSAQVLPNLMNAERLAMGMPTEITQNLNTEERVVKIQTTEQLSEIVHALTGIVGEQPTHDPDSSPGDPPDDSPVLRLERGDPEPDRDDDGWGEAEVIEVSDPED